MLPLNEISAIIALVFCCSNSHALDMKNYTRTWTLSPNTSHAFVQGTLFTNNDHTYPYAICTTSKPNIQKLCNVAVVTPYSKDRTCSSVKIFSGDDGRQLFLGGFYQVVPFPNDLVLIIWSDEARNAEGVKVRQSYQKHIPIMWDLGMLQPKLVAFSR